VKSAKGLTAKQDKFVREYLIDKNATQAAIRAGYSPRSAGNIGKAILRNPTVSRVLDKQLNAVQKEAAVDAAWVLKQLKEVAAQDDVASGTKVRALELMAKHFGMLQDNINLKTDGLSSEQRAERVAILLERVRTRE
jgi:phage terminase small subunit